MARNRHVCATCRVGFTSRTKLHRHLRKEQHQWLGESPSDLKGLPVDVFVGSTIKNASGRAASPTDEPAEGETRAHPGPLLRIDEITSRERQWTDIGSGIMAKTFVNMKRLTTTSRGGPPLQDIQSRRIRSLTTGKIIDECDIENTPDEQLYRELERPDNLRVEVTLKGAEKLFMRHGPDIVEVFSQPRVCQEMDKRLFGGQALKPGWSLDLTNKDPATGRAWDLSRPEVQSRVRKLVRDTEPYCVIGSPPCTAFSPLQELGRAKRDKRVMARELEAGKKHVRFCLELYKMQLQARRHFIHEHPERSRAWAMPEVVDMMMRPEVGSTVLHMCAYGMMAKDEKGTAHVQKATRVMSSSEEVLKRVSRRCTNEDGHSKHRHVQLISGRAKQAQVYPRAFGIAICQGVAAQRRLEILGMKARPVMSIAEMKEISSAESAGCPSEALHENHGETWVAYDDVSGQQLDPSLMRQARCEEIKYFKEMGVYTKVDIGECWAATGKAPIAVRWVDINKGDSLNPNYRSRLVAKEFNTGPCPELYAATPPSECLRLLLSRMASGRQAGIGLVYADVSRAYFYAKAVRPVFVKLPDEDLESGDEGRCGKLHMSMYGTRDAALNWALEYADTLRAAGYIQGKANPCLFQNTKIGVSIMVHGDDFVAVGPTQHLEHVKKTLSDK